MTVLASLVRAYDRMADRSGIPPYGYSSEKIAFVIPLAENGMPAGEPVDLRQGKKAQPRPMIVPESVERTGTKLQACFLWDNSSYALGVSGSPGKDALLRHRAFQERHRRDLAGSDDPGLLALLRFLEWWTPERFEELGWPEGLKDQNVVFALDGERRERMIHDRPAARDLWARLSATDGGTAGVCLVTGERSPIARLHRPIKGVRNAQPSGARLVSFNLDAFRSYGHKQGENAPVSDAAAFKYASALNHFLRSPQCIQIGDASTVFWADADDAAIADQSEALFGALLGIDEGKEAAKIRPILEKMRAGRPIAEAAPHLAEGVRFFVLGLAPNAARLSVRFYLEDDFSALMRRFARHAEAMRIDPPPREENPSIWRCLIETAAQRKSENILPNLAGEWLRAILTGRPYPLTLLASVLMRIRSDKSDKKVNALRVAMLKAVLITREREVVPVSLDPESRDPGYLLGRLFAAYEYLQTQALGASINATIRDKYYGTASATPRAVFPLLQRMATHHLARLRKDHPGRARWIDDQIGRIFELADMHLLTPTLNTQRQAMFAVGYYHQKNDFYRTRDNAPAEAEALSEESTQ